MFHTGLSDLLLRSSVPVKAHPCSHDWGRGQAVSIVSVLGEVCTAEKKNTLTLVIGLWFYMRKSDINVLLFRLIFV